MKLDLFATLELTLSASLVIAMFSIGFGATIARRVRLAAALLAWFVFVAILATSQAIPQSARTPALGLLVVIPVIALSLAASRSAYLKERLANIPITLLVGLNVVRVLGVMFLLLYSAGRLPAPFAPVAGYGDILVGVLAIPVAWMVHTRGEEVRGVLLAWNTLGLADLVAAVGLGVVSSPGQLQFIHAEPSAAIMTTMPWMLIPAFLVPLLIASHLAIFHRLRAPRSVGNMTPISA